MKEEIFQADEPVQEEKEAFSEGRQRAIKRMYKLLYLFVDRMFREEDAEEKEAAEFERKCEAEPDGLQYRISAHGNNVEVMKDCMRETRDVVTCLNNRENIIEEWQIAGIHAMCDQCNMERTLPYDLPTAIKGLLCMHILSRPLCIEVVTE